MSPEGQILYPGATATPLQIIALADEYRRGADALLPMGRSGKLISRAPYRLMAIHAVELYLNALLLAAGHPPSKVRGLNHDLLLRTRLAVDAKLSLRKRTLTHLETLSRTREYLVIRYDPVATIASETTRLAATLTEVADKVTRLVQRSAD